MIKLLLEAIKEWVESLLKSYAEKKDIVVYCPDDKGAVGDGVTIDDDAFLEGNYVYQLTEGKIYSVTLEKLRAICNNTCTGKGVIRFYRNNYYHTHPYQNNVDILPVYGDGTGRNIVELSARSKKNRLLECINHISNEQSYNTVGMNRYYRTQGVSVKEGEAHTYHGIGAVQHEYDKELPDRFTICLGRQKILTREKGGTTWKKTIDELPSPATGVRNYGLPWGGQSGEAARAFNNPPKIAGDHLEVTVEKEEFLSWLGSGTKLTEGNLHFWTHNYNAAADEFYDAIICQEAWVKEPEASNKLLYTLGIDCFRDYNSTTKKYGYFSQIIYDVQHHLTTEPQVFYGCTMGIDEALAVDFDEISSLMSDNKLSKKSTLANYNLLGFTDDFTITRGAYTLEYSKADDVFTFSIDPNATQGWQSIDLTQYLADIPNIKAGDSFRCYIMPLEGTYVHQGTFYYSSGKTIAMSSGYSTTDGVIHKSFVAEKDFTQLVFGTSATKVQYPKFRIWLTKGEIYKGYQPYGENVDALYQPNNVINPITEERLNEADKRIDELKRKTDYIETPTTTEQSTMSANSDIQTEVQTKIADTSKQYLVKVKDVITGNNIYIAVANGRFVALTEAEINAHHPN